MVDIEHKTLKLLEQNLLQIRVFLLKKEEVKSSIFDDVTTIDVWNEEMRLENYKEIAKKIFEHADVSLIHSTLATIKNLFNLEKDPTLAMIYSVLCSFFEFFDKIYEAFLLNQIVYLLMNFSEEELSLPETVFQAYKTNSYLETVLFGLLIEQTKIYSFHDEGFSLYLYHVKTECKECIKKYLLIPSYRRKFHTLNQTLENYVFGEGKDNYYANKLFIALNSNFKRGEQKRVRRKNKKEVENQLSFFS